MCSRSQFRRSSAVLLSTTTTTHHPITQPVEIRPSPKQTQRRIEETKALSPLSQPSVHRPRALLRFKNSPSVFFVTFPPSPHLLSSLAAEVSSLFLGPACAVVPVYPTGRRDSLARRGRHSAMVCVCRCFPAGSHGDCRLYMCFGRDDGERVGYAILAAVVCMQTTWTVRSVDVARMGEYDFDGPHVCLQLCHCMSFYSSLPPMSGSVVMSPSPSRAL